MTTLDCNARCFYCYEKGRARITMTEETANNVATCIIDNANGSKVHISWFGGEPLVNYQVIDIICDRLASAKIRYSSSMISNGLLFSPEILNKAKQNWKLGRVQITLDGTKEVYQKSKAFVKADGTEFDRVLDNIETLLRNDIAVVVRLNQDVYNTDDLLQLVDLLNERLGEYKNFKVYNHILFNDDHVLTDEQIDCHYKLSNKIVSSSLSSNPKLLSGPKVYSCMADSPTSRVITPDGKFGKCEHYSSEYLVGSLDGNDIDNEMLYKWAERYGRQEACDSCPLYPVCVRIKMCPNDSPVCYEFDREKEISMIKRAMLMAYEDYRKSKS